jgi:hypothetical protein
LNPINYAMTTPNMPDEKERARTILSLSAMDGSCKSHQEGNGADTEDLADIKAAKDRAIKDKAAKEMTQHILDLMHRASAVGHEESNYESIDQGKVAGSTPSTKGVHQAVMAERAMKEKLKVVSDEYDYESIDQGKASASMFSTKGVKQAVMAEEGMQEKLKVVVNEMIEAYTEDTVNSMAAQEEGAESVDAPEQAPSSENQAPTTAAPLPGLTRTSLPRHVSRPGAMAVYPSGHTPDAAVDDIELESESSVTDVEAGGNETTNEEVLLKATLVDDSEHEVVEAEPALKGFRAIVANSRFKYLAALFLLVLLAVVIPVALFAPSDAPIAPANVTTVLSGPLVCGTRETKQTDYRYCSDRKRQDLSSKCESRKMKHTKDY